MAEASGELEWQICLGKSSVLLCWLCKAILFHCGTIWQGRHMPLVFLSQSWALKGGGYVRFSIAITVKETSTPFFSPPSSAQKDAWDASPRSSLLRNILGLFARAWALILHYIAVITCRLKVRVLWGVLKNLLLLSVKHDKHDKQRSQAIWVLVPDI